MPPNPYFPGGPSWLPTMQNNEIVHQSFSQPSNHPTGAAHLLPDGAPRMEAPHRIASGHPAVAQDWVANNNPSRQAAAGTRSTPRRIRYENLDWERHKSVLNRLYLTENKSLNQIIDIMGKEHSFHASSKLYKDKFKEWEWQKNLSAEHASIMVFKAEKRKREGKETVFFYGGQSWSTARAQKSLSRTKKARYGEELIDVETPIGISYKTPKANHVSPNQAMVVSPVYDAQLHPHDEIEPAQSALQGSSSHPLPVDLSDESQVETIESDRSIEEIENSSDDASDDSPGALIEALPLRWKGLTRGDLLSMEESAQHSLKSGALNGAERLLLQVLEGYRFLLGSVHEETNKVAYKLASFYAENDRMLEADELIENLSRKLIEKFGYSHRRTQQHVLHSIELLNSWHREEDALSFLAHAKELRSQHSTVTPGHAHRSNQRQIPTRASTRGRAKATMIATPVHDDDIVTLTDIENFLDNDDSPSSLDLGLSIARSHVAAKDTTTEQLLLKMIYLCETRPANRQIQHLKARAELLSLYEKLGAVDENDTAFTESETCFNAIWRDYEWDREKFESLEVVEAGMQLTLSMLKAGFESEAQDMFNKISETASDTFHRDDERTVWIHISIGLAYQTYEDWEQAGPWFEHALSTALSIWEEDDGITKSLEKGLANKHFTYLSDEGRPFRTIFGVSGITIMPGRLHMC